MPPRWGFFHWVTFCLAVVAVACLLAPQLGRALYEQFLCGPRVCVAHTQVERADDLYYVTARLLTCSDPADRDGRRAAGHVEELLLLRSPSHDAATHFRQELPTRLTVWPNANPLEPGMDGRCHRVALLVTGVCLLFVGFFITTGLLGLTLGAYSLGKYFVRAIPGPDDEKEEEEGALVEKESEKVRKTVCTA